MPRFAYRREPASIRSTARGRCKRAIQANIENPLAKHILEGEFAAKDVIKVDAAKGRIVFEKTADTQQSPRAAA